MPNDKLRKLRILVMDDEEMIRRLLTRILTGAGYEVENTKDGGEAIESYQAAIRDGNSFDAVILDLTIPGGIVGEEVIQELKLIDPGVRAIVSSGYSSNKIMANYRDYGFCDVAVKPYGVKEITATLGRVLKQGN